MAGIEVRDLSHRYPGAKELTLDGIDLQLADGEAHAILGGSGTGKTTLLNLLAGLLVPERGSVKFDGRDVTGLSGAQRNVAQVFQFPVLYPSLDVTGNLEFPLRNRGWSREAARTRVLEVARLLELEALLDRQPAGLSLFEKQLIAIGRALVRPDVAIVLLDEPLTAVEPATKWRLRRALKTVQTELGLTMVYVTHDQTEALTFADKITMLHEGRVLQTGTPLELYERPAHQIVAHFIGSPGMNLIDAHVSAGALHVGDTSVGPVSAAPGTCVLGFRPEWAEIGEVGIPVTVQSTRVTGTEEGVAVGLVAARLDDQVVYTRQVLGGSLGQDARLRIDADRLIVFRDQHRFDHD